MRHHLVFWSSTSSTRTSNSLLKMVCPPSHPACFDAFGVVILRSVDSPKIECPLEHPEQKKLPAILPTRNIRPTQIDPDALKVVRRLQRFGHTAYLVGGCVRDLLLKRTPKDFDVATSAEPQEIRKIFRNCRLIGRRFRLAQIYFKSKVIETATFRAALEESSPEKNDLLIRSDNVFGTEQEDARRRDFTINALFYDPVACLLIDHVGGLEDLVSRTIRFIGEPEVRVQEDPVRTLRAVKFAAQLNFSIEKKSWEALVRYKTDLEKAARPRLLEELFRLLRGKAAEASFRLLWEAKALEVLLPELAVFLSRPEEPKETPVMENDLWSSLRSVDHFEGGVLSDSVLFAAVMIHPVMDAARNGLRAYGLSTHSNAFGEIARTMLTGLVERMRLPKWKSEQIQQILACQKRLYQLRPNSPPPRTLLHRAYFPEALDLFEVTAGDFGNHRAILLKLRRALGSSAPRESSGHHHPRRRKHARSFPVRTPVRNRG
jgi:poly(A) polymerase